MKFTTKKWFTLIEMLIVIVIIGVLAAALIPRLSSARWKANDTARKADLQQIATALIAYQMDQNSYPPIGVYLWDNLTSQNGEGIGTLLMRGGLVNIPRDPGNALTSGGLFIGPWSITGAKWSYLYTPVTKNGILSWGFILMAVAETEGWANYVYCPGKTPIITGWTTIAEGAWGIKLCKSIRKAPSGSTNCTWRLTTYSGEVDCQYTNASELRYVYMY
jgi:prepilin-type N-terminal cleavage/methylation domain-containing protein